MKERVCTGRKKWLGATVDKKYEDVLRMRLGADRKEAERRIDSLLDARVDHRNGLLTL